MEQNALIERIQQDLNNAENELAKVREYRKQLEARAMALRGALSVLREVAGDETLQRQLLPHLFETEADGVGGDGGIKNAPGDGPGACCVQGSGGTPL